LWIEKSEEDFNLSKTAQLIDARQILNMRNDQKFKHIAYNVQENEDHRSELLE